MISYLGPYSIDDIYCGDSAVMLAALPDGCIDLTVTSPPYDDMDDNFNPIPARGLRQYNGYTWDFKEMARQLYRVTKPGGVVVWVVGDPTIDGSESLASSLQKIYFRRLGFNVHDTMIYAKPGNPAPQNPPVRYSQNSEFMFVLSKGTVSTFNPIMRFGAEVGVRSKTKRNRKGEIKKGFYTSGTGFPESNVWEVYPDHMESGITHKHPATFPESLARDHIISWSNPGDIVLDPFSGSGTTAKMSKVLSRHWLGFDISQEYVDLARRRVAAANVPLPLFVEQPAKPRQDVLL